MEGRIGELHVRYHTPRGGPIAAARTPAIDLALAARLGDAVAERLEHVLADDRSVIVVRDLTSRVALGPADWALDARAVDRLSRASCAALADVLHADPPPDLVMRFDDEPAFVGSFLVALLGGSPWEQWYFGAFRPYRATDARQVALAVLSDHSYHAPRVFGWLARRGKLDAVLALIGAENGRRVITGASLSTYDQARSPDLNTLTDAAMMLVESLGWRDDTDSIANRAIAQYVESSPVPPTWTDRRSLTAWVLACARHVMTTLVRSEVRRGTWDIAAVRDLLQRRLDWLDGEWLEESLLRVAEPDTNVTSATLREPRRVLAVRHERLFERLTELVRARRITFARGADHHAIVVRLLAALADLSVSDEPLDRALVVTSERIGEAWAAIQSSGMDRRVVVAALSSATAAPSLVHDRELARAVDRVRTIAPAAVEALREIVIATVGRAPEAGEETPFGGLFVLTRGLLDVRLRALALHAGVPFDLLLAGLAAEWFGAAPPYDVPTALWIGADTCDLRVLDGLERPLERLRDELVQVLVDRRSIEAAPPEALTGPPIAAIASLIIRGWARWLPGIANASTPFLIEKCLARAARVGTTPTTIDVRLDPAPLDVVLEMAGYLRPLEAVPWLDGRSITLAVTRAH